MSFRQFFFATVFSVLLLAIFLPKFFVYDDPKISADLHNCSDQGAQAKLTQMEKIAFVLGTHKITAWQGTNTLVDIMTPFDVRFATVSIHCDPGPPYNPALVPTDIKIQRYFNW